MDPDEVARAVAGVTATAVDLTLDAQDATIIQNSSKLALRLLPCDAFARVAPVNQAAQLGFEIELAQQLGVAGAPVAALDARVEPRVYECDGFAVTFWTFYHAPGPLSPHDYALALERLHVSMRGVALATPHFTDRIAEAEALVTDCERTPALNEPGRDLLLDTFTSVRQTIDGAGATEQVLHGEPHPGNILNTTEGPRFIDLETCCRGPVEFDLAHVPRDVSAHYPGIDQDLLIACRQLVLAMIAAWRWDKDDEFPDGLRHGRNILDLLRQGPPWPTIAELT